VTAVIESFPLALASYAIDSSIRVYRVLCGHDEHCFSCLRCTPLLYGAARERPTVTRTTDAPDQGADGDPSINGRSHS
jgi:hypothetical protein